MDTIIADINACESAEDIKMYLSVINKKQLENIVKILKHQYYFDTALVTDQVYDQIEDFAKAKGIKIKVGASQKEMVELPFYLSSLDKIKLDEEVIKYFAKADAEEYVIMNKLNGVSGLYVCDDDKRCRLYTRGDHNKGQDISHLLKYFNLPQIRGLAVRGELVLTNDGWNEVHEAYPEFRNALGAVVGVVNKKTLTASETFRLERIQFVTYEIVNYKNHHYRISQQLSKLKKWGFPTVQYFKVTETPTPESLSVQYSEQREKADHDIDGLVITSNIKYDRCHGDNPTYSVAYKKLIEVRQTTITHISWKTSKSGKLCPTAHYETVVIAGSTCNKTTLHNAKMVVAKGLGKGAIIEIQLLISPQLVRVIKPVEADMPDCEYEWNENNTHIYAVMDKESEEVKINKICNFMLKVGVKNFAKGLIAKCVEAGLDTIMKLLKATVADFLTVPTIKDINANKIRTNIHSALREASLAQVMAGSNCFEENIGVRKLEPVVSRFPNLLTEEITEEELLQVQGCKEKTAERIAVGLTKFKKLWKELSKYYTPVVKEIKVDEESEFNGKSYVFSEFRDKELEQKIVAGGGKVTTTVSSKTTALVVKSLQSETGKVIKAKQLGVSIILYSSFK